ncbi:MAG: NAD(P)/FAD-dependent oxidoreductase [Elusimicrobia bacterium]|nr:NAD(P)/FAD-dependent oxidoreductase [Elusimicrobiota bacterium]
MSVRVGVIGGGASGLVTAITAARRGASVTLFEASPRLGRKILASGGGRCNLGNARLGPDHYHGSDREFVRRVLSRFGNGESRRFFEGLGLMLVQEPDGRLFPRSGQAKSVLAVLEAGLNLAGVAVERGCEVSAVRPLGHGPRPGGFSVETAKHGALEFDRVVLSCGGASYPQLGGGGRGYSLARALGLSVVEPTPALVPLVSKDAWIRRLQGIRVQAGIAAQVEGKTIAASQGELLFTAYGISGPAALDLSRKVCRALVRHPKVDCFLNLFPEFLAFDLDRLFRSRLESMGPVAGGTFLRGMLPERVAEVFLSGLGRGISSHEPVSEEAVLLLARRTSRWRFVVTGHRPWDEAMVSAGGVKLAEIHPETMESKTRRGLHVAGELLDADGDSGGYNLHFAWATGSICGGSCAGQKC